MKKILLVCLLSSLFVGCATAPLISRPAFPVDEYEALNSRVGTGTVKGQAFLKTRGGDVKTGAGSEVQLYPVTKYSLFWYQNAYLNGVNLEEADVRYTKYIRSTTADAQGNFYFENLPAGEYFVTTMITWEVPTGRNFATTTGGSIAKRVVVFNDKTTNVILTH